MSEDTKQNPDLDWYYDQIKDATLEPLEVGEKVKSFYLRKTPGRHSMSTLLIFSPEGIVITGDLRPTQRGCIAMGYGMDWFSQKQEPNYLAKKFLDEVWLPEAMEAYIRQRIAEIRAGEPEYKATKAEWRVLNREITGTEADALSLMLKLQETVVDVFGTADRTWECLPSYWDRNKKSWVMPYDSDILSYGFGYMPHELGWLAAIQRRFAETVTK